jgi:hypothetical protein
MFADVLYACDEQWWRVHEEKTRATFKGERWTQDYSASKNYGIHRIGSENLPGLGRYDVIHQGGNSGYQAINLAYLWGAQTIILLGLDCSKSPDGQAHWFGQHGPGLTQQQPYDIWQASFPALAQDIKDEGVRVINCSRQTALTCFERMTLKDAINEYATK